MQRDVASDCDAELVDGDHMSWREKFFTHVGSGYFHGTTFGEWLSLLRENRFAIAPSCWMRAALMTILSIPNGALRRLEEFRFRAAWEAVEIPPPLFILGHYRCGTTHLHNLLGVDPRFAYLNTYQASYPDTFLITERFGAPAVRFFAPRTRAFDNVRVACDVPQEDEIAMTTALRISPYMSGVFPQRAAHYDRFLTFRDATADEVARWRAGLLQLLKKLSFKYHKPLVLKSPPHTGRIKLLLDIFPQAKFVHIHRDPYVVIQSTLHMIRVAREWIRLQNGAVVDWTERALRQYREMYDAYFEEQPLIPAGNFHDMAFVDLDRDPLGELRRMYTALKLPAFDEVEPAIANYVQSLSSYAKNKFPEIPADLKAQVREYCARGFDEWAYPR